MGSMDVTDGAVADADDASDGRNTARRPSTRSSRYAANSAVTQEKLEDEIDSLR